jgi:hypothetical protein
MVGVDEQLEVGPEFKGILVQVPGGDTQVDGGKRGSDG